MKLHLVSHRSRFALSRTRSNSYPPGWYSAVARRSRRNTHVRVFDGSWSTHPRDPNAKRSEEPFSKRTPISPSERLPTVGVHALSFAFNSQRIRSLVGGARHTVARRFDRPLRSLPFRSVPCLPPHRSLRKLPLPRCQLPPSDVSSPSLLPAAALATPLQRVAARDSSFFRAPPARLLSRGCERDRQGVEWRRRVTDKDGKPVSSF